MDCSLPGFLLLHCLLVFAETHVIESIMLSNYPILCHPLIFLPQSFQGLFQWLGSLHQMTKVLEVQLQLRFFQWIFSVDFLRIDWFVLFAVQGTLKSLLQHHSLKASILQHSAFFMVQLSHPYMTTGKMISLTIWTLVDKIMPLLFNMLSRFVIPFLPRRKRLLISWLWSPSAVILGTKKIKYVTVSTVSPSISMKWWDWVPCYLRVISGL